MNILLKQKNLYVLLTGFSIAVKLLFKIGYDVIGLIHPAHVVFISNFQTGNFYLTAAG